MMGGGAIGSPSLGFALSVLLLGTLQAFAAATCGEGVGDLRAEATATEACKACFGTRGHLDFNASFAEGVGFTFCQDAAQPAIENSGRICMEASTQGGGDLRAETSLLAACRACMGDTAQLDFFPDPSGKGGYTFCRAPDGREVRSTPQVIALRPKCGEGLGDVRNDTGAEAKCTKCQGASAHLRIYFVAAEGVWHTLCQAQQPDDVRQAVGQDAGRRLTLRGLAKEDRVPSEIEGFDGTLV